jgi:PAS domain S-box-containing protein
MGLLESVFPGNSELAWRMRQLDWSKTPLGPVEGWTQSLRTSVSTCLDCAFGIILWWGPKLAVLYNDECRAFLSPEKHPALLGQPGSVMWAEIWDTIEPMLRRVIERGEATRSRDLLLHIVRAGHPEEAYFSFSYSPIRDDDGGIGGVFCPVIETTDKVIGERRLRTLRDLAAECKGAESEPEVFASAARILEANPCDIPFALVYRVDQDGALALLEKSIGIEAGRAASPRHVPLSDAGDDPWSLSEVARSGQPRVVTALRKFGEELPTGAWQVAPQSAIVLPVSRPGAAGPHAILVAAISPMRPLDEPYRTFFGLVATQIASGLADAGALEEQRRNVSHEFRTPLTLKTETALRNRTEQFRTLINQAPLGVYLVDADFRIRDVNPIALPAFGDIPGGVEGRDFDEIMHILWEKDFADQVVGTLRQVLETGIPYVTPEQARYRIDRNVVEYYEWRFDRITLPDGRYGVVCYFSDISAHVHARHELAASVDRLSSAERALREASRHKDDFLAILAHEMRNPLAPILNSLQILRSPSTSDPVRQQAQAMMERQVSQLKRLVEDLLDVARITRGEIALQRESTSLTPILEHAIDTSRPLIDAAGHRLTLALPEEPVIIDADAVRLTQVFTNLLNNAAKYTDRAGRIDVVVTSQPRTVEITITDSGRGIAPDSMPRLFELFARGGESTERAMGGLGIGLGVVRKLIELHGGEVQAMSAGRGQGSTFVVRLPRSERRASPRGAPNETTPGSSPLSLQRVLVVDDNRDAADSLGMLLQLQGIDAHIVYDGSKALAALREYRPTLVFLDIGMPGMDGYEVARRMRARPEGRDVVLIALTGWGQEADRRRARSVGFDHHLTKPIDVDALPRLLQDLIVQKI